MTPALGWTVLGLVFLDEVAAAVAAGVAAGHAWGVPGAVLGPLVVVAVWWAFASPRAPWGTRVVRPVVKVLVFGLASAGLWLVGLHGWAVALLASSVLVNAAAQHPEVRALAAGTP
ncbi:MAG TPA: DUF2568 domain-containing protein [Marmoricola sp.]|nr:DUF2568 domain-containing protein [Marmoricola sp.]